jgi:hypothetical protein
MNAPTNEILMPVDFAPTNNRGICIPKGCRVLSIAGEICRTPGPNGATRIYVHPEDIEKVKAANQS